MLTLLLAFFVPMVIGFLVTKTLMRDEAAFRARRNAIRARSLGKSMDILFPVGSKEKPVEINPDPTPLELEMLIGPAANIVANESLIGEIENLWNAEQEAKRAAEARRIRDPRSWTDEEISEWKTFARTPIPALPPHARRVTHDGETHEITSWGEIEPIRVHGPNMSVEAFRKLSLLQLDSMIRDGSISSDWLVEMWARSSRERRERLGVKRSPRPSWY